MLDSSAGSAAILLGTIRSRVRDMARAFAAEALAPHAVEWDEDKHFPVDVLRQAAALGMGGIYVARGRRRLRRCRGWTPR